MINANPIVYEIQKNSAIEENLDYKDETAREPLNSAEVFEYIRSLNDPEHPLTLEQLNVVSEKDILTSDEKNVVIVRFTPTVPHCSMATLIGFVFV
eukprot:CAMPEP_0182424906 /NCGR_PEP_ID=MMETSP1167-20130531/11183_1 /TAXON_ID=2988 /ORGANISM="Mallomonas Sp, Strain CCMP3275" /LENGTH=95 /DNA_ID=CAMNT_0024605077 /DNA_START=128 /DNA_END=416 /DNA_ORIENTATION=+